jgi:hypothetical protein
MSNIADLDIDTLGEERLPPKEGWYHIKLIQHKEDTTQRGTVHKCTWQIIGTPPELRDELGKYVYESYYVYASVFAKQCAIIGWACGLYSKEYLADLQAKGADLPIPDFGTWLLTTCIGKVRHETDKDDPKKSYARIGFDYKPVSHESVKIHGIVLDKASIEAGVPTQSANSNADVF